LNCRVSHSKTFWLWRNGLKSQLTPQFNSRSDRCKSKVFGALI
jgi:hypothetical protein